MKLFQSSQSASAQTYALATFKFLACLSIASHKYDCLDVMKDECTFSTIDEAKIFLTNFKSNAVTYSNTRWWGPLSDKDTLTYEFKIQNLTNNEKTTFSSLDSCEKWIAAMQEEQRNELLNVAKVASTI